MPSLVTSVVGGIQGRSAANNAVKEQVAAALKAAGIVDAATQEVNPQILEAAMQAVSGMNAATGTAIDGVRTAATGANDLLNPYATAGTDAVRSLQELTQNPQNFAPSDLTMDPGYQFRLDEVQKRLERSAAASGTLRGGGAFWTWAIKRATPSFSFGNGVVPVSAKYATQPRA